MVWAIGDGADGGDNVPARGRDGGPLQARPPAVPRRRVRRAARGEEYERQLQARVRALRLDRRAHAGQPRLAQPRGGLRPVLEGRGPRDQPALLLVQDRRLGDHQPELGVRAGGRIAAAPLAGAAGARGAGRAGSPSGTGRSRTPAGTETRRGHAAPVARGAGARRPRPERPRPQLPALQAPRRDRAADLGRGRARPVLERRERPAAGVGRGRRVRRPAPRPAARRGALPLRGPTRAARCTQRHASAAAPTG